MRAHPVYTAFERRWQLPVYFQLRWKEIVTKLEEPLVVTKIERTGSKGTFTAAIDAARVLTMTISFGAICDPTSCGGVGGHLDLLERERLHP